jgi:predicted TIM-barrel fold metal-dependent hydrolase
MAAAAAAVPGAPADLEFWDCHAAIGRWTLPPPAGALDPSELCEELAYAGIAGALVHHGLGRDYDPAAGNDVLLQELAPEAPRPLVPCVTLLPPDTGEFPPLEEHLPDLVRRGVRGVRLYPKSHNFSLEEWCAGDLLAALERHRLPVSIDLAETNWSALHGVCAAHPALPVVVTRVNYRNERYLYPLLRQHSRLHVELSFFQGHRAIEEVVDRFGPERLLFGTGLPFFTAGAPVVMVVRADVGDAARRAIAGENLRRLMAEVRP